MTTLNLYIIRHGNTFDPGDTLLRVGAKTDLPLSSSGEQQAQALGRHFKNHQRFPDKIFCSNLQRTQQTADIALSMMNPLPHMPALTPLEWLNEIDYGPDEGQPETQVIQRIGADALSQWEQHSVVPPGWLVQPEKIKTAWLEFLATLTAFDQNQDKTTPQEQHIWVVTSNGIARFVLDALNLSNASLNRKLKTAHYGHLKYPLHEQPKHLNEKQWHCVEWNIAPT